MGSRKYGYRSKFGRPVSLLYSGDSTRSRSAISTTDRCGVGRNADRMAATI